MSNSERVTNTEGLLLCNRVANQQKLNRALDQKILEAIVHPTQNHLIVVALPFHNESDHHRCRVWAAQRLSEEPYEFFLDIPVNLFEQMETVSDHLARA